MRIKTNHLSNYVFILAHGAGADQNSEWMLAMDYLLTQAGISVIRFNFPYMEKRQQDGRRRPPDRQPKLISAFYDQINQIPKNKKVIIGGKSMGGRIASLLACELGYRLSISAVICLGFPFHPPGQPDKFRGDHLAKIKIPTLIVQGERDTFGSYAEIQVYQFSSNVVLYFVTDGDHSFKPRIKSGVTLEQNLQSASHQIIKFLNSL